MYLLRRPIVLRINEGHQHVEHSPPYRVRTSTSFLHLPSSNITQVCHGVKQLYQMRVPRGGVLNM